MERRVVFTHLTGTKASTTEEFLVGSFTELTFGREPSCDVRYDKDRDDFVSRRHMKLVLTDADVPEFSIVDLNSRNGVLVNNQRVAGSVKIRPGDVVQIGAGGPQFSFDIEPQTRELPATALLEAFSKNPVAEQPRPAADEPARDVSSPEADQPIVRSRQPRWTRRRTLLSISVAAFITTAAIILALYWFANGLRQAQDVADSALSWTKTGVKRTNSAVSAAATHIGEYIGAIPRWLSRWKNAKSAAAETQKQPLESLAAIETAWKLIDSESGRQLQQVYIRNENAQADGDRTALVVGAGRDLPVFVLVDGNHLQPMLTFAENRSYRPIAKTSRGTGFIVSTDGVILTNRRVAEPWSAPYEWPAEDQVGIVAVLGQALQVEQTAVISRRQFPKWLPTDAGFVLESSLVWGPVGVSGRRVRASGKVEQLKVVLHDGTEPMPARLVRSSDRADLATIRIDAAVSSQTISIHATSDCKPGDLVRVVTSFEHARVMRTGRVATLWRQQDEILGTGEKWPADTYEVYVGVEDAGTMGSPIVDEQGRVVAVQTGSEPLQPTTVFAVPTRYAKELIGEEASPH